MSLLHALHQLAWPNSMSSSFIATEDLWTMSSGGDPPCRLDYIWVSGIPDKARLAMQQAQHDCSYSDHLGVEVVCTFRDEHAHRCLSACQSIHVKLLHVQLVYVCKSTSLSSWFARANAGLITLLGAAAIAAQHPRQYCTAWSGFCQHYCSCWRTADCKLLHCRMLQLPPRDSVRKHPELFRVALGQLQQGMHQFARHP